ncbi:MAG: 1-acyl-sn-glycerol-3-phosphate acyltransferase [Crocinitomicaceae bacterium]|nr:1-acyl-sn-glycerol-3-phosphate acyltransferase [Crocinitomicaceae bacterium]
MMRPLYFILKQVFKYSLWIYYPRVKVVNAPKKYLTRTIYASNHAASFMDQLVVETMNKPIVFFMTRSDVFTTLLKPILWAVHMLPIYRSHDGEDTKKKNEAVFKICNKILKGGRSLLIFSEGFTDDVFIRRLKPIKKGAVRIGMGALESIDWKKDIYLQAVGVNYGHPNVIGSDVVIAYGQPILLNVYKEDYLENPNKVINDLTALLEKEMQAQLTYIENADWAPMHEQIMCLTKKGLNPENRDTTIPLLTRWQYSRELANWMNQLDLENNTLLKELKSDLEAFFADLKHNGISEKLLSLNERKNSPCSSWWYWLLIFPIALLGFIHNYPAYAIVKPFVEKSFKRSVFWGSVKMTLGTLVNAIYNVILLLLLHHLVYANVLFWVLYLFVVIGPTGIIAYNYYQNWFNRKGLTRLLKISNLEKIYAQRDALKERIKALIPVA